MTEPIGESLKQMQSSRFCCPVVELRQYTLHPGKRDILIELFDREFIEIAGGGWNKGRPSPTARSLLRG